MVSKAPVLKDVTRAWSRKHLSGNDWVGGGPSGQAFIS